MVDKRFPLAWPAGWKRTAPAARQRATFGIRKQPAGSTWKRLEPLSIGEAVRRLEEELGRMGARAWVLSSDMRYRLDGLPYSNQPTPKDPGVAVYFRLGGKDRVLACDRWHRIADNIAAVAAHIECVRGIDRYGVGTLDQAFAGYAALPPSAEDWRSVFELPQGATLGDVEARFRELARLHHPDVGGDPAQMAKLSAARDAARQELGQATP